MREYERCTREAGVEALGGEGRDLCEGQWWVGEKAAACFAEVGEGRSFFEGAGSFFWVADKAYRVSGGKYSGFLPAEVIGTPEGRTVHLFVRRSGEGDYLYVGEMSGSYMQQVSRREGSFGRAHFELREALPTALWEAWGNVKKAGVGDTASVDAALARMRGETTVEERLGVLRTVVEYWHGAIGEGDGLSGEEVEKGSLPGVLAWWYRWAGRRKEILSGQNHLLGPGQVEMEEGKLLFYGENQWVYRWGVDVEGEDPAVYGRYELGEPWEEEGVRLSEHLLMACLIEAVMCHAPYGGSASVKEEVLAELSREMGVLAGRWRWCGETRFYARGGAFMCALTEGEGRYTVMVGAKRAEEVAFLRKYAGQGWNRLVV